MKTIQTKHTHTDKSKTYKQTTWLEQFNLTLKKKTNNKTPQKNPPWQTTNHHVFPYLNVPFNSICTLKSDSTHLKLFSFLPNLAFQLEKNIHEKKLGVEESGIFCMCCSHIYLMLHWCSVATSSQVQHQQKQYKMITSGSLMPISWVTLPFHLWLTAY